MQQLQQQNQPASSLIGGGGSSGASSITNWLDVQNKISETFDGFIVDFRTHIDFYFKSYNKNLKENIEIQIKASKKERAKYIQFLNHQEKVYWKDFPRKKHFYHENLRKLYQFFQQGKNPQGSRDISLIVSGILNMMPLASKKFCRKFEIEQIFHQDQENKHTFDTLTESLKMFDSDDMANWRLLGFTVSLLVADTLQIFLDQVASGDRDIKISATVIDVLLDVCRYYAIIQTFQESGDGGGNNQAIEEETVSDLYFKQTQGAWAKLFGNLSRLHFDKCMKQLMQSLQQDFRKLKEEETEQQAQRIYFSRYIQIKPQDKLQASHVQILFDNFLTIMSSKSITLQMKNVLIITLKYLVEQLNFSGQDFNFDSPMGILWPTIENIHKLAVKYTKKEFYKEYAYQLLIIIIKISPNDFCNLNMAKLMKREKIQSLFETKKSYMQGIALMIELCVGMPLSTNKFQDWRPKVHSNQFILVDNLNQGILMPMRIYKRSYRFRLARKLSSTDSLPFSFRDSFRFIFNPKLVTDVTHLHVQYLRQMLFEDLDFFNSTALPFLLSFLKNQERLDLPLLGLKLADFALNPVHNFKNEYSRLQPQQAGSIKQYLGQLQSYLSQVVKEILRSQLLKSEFQSELANFYKSEDKELCNDQMSIIWSRQQQGLYTSGRHISQVLKQKQVASFYLAEAKRQISFEDFREIAKLNEPLSKDAMAEDKDVEYLADQFNLVSVALSKEQREWDYQKEKFFRYRLQSFLSEERKEGQRQNTTQFSTSEQKFEEIKFLKRVLKMVTYLPEVQDSFKFFPTRRLLIEESAILTNKVPEQNFPDIDGENSPQANSMGEGVLGLQNNLKKKKSDPKFPYRQLNPKLREVQNLLPYHLMNLNFDIANQSGKFIQKLMVYGDFKMRLALVDQMLYFVKEFMLDSPEEHLLNQYLQLLITMIKIWHHSERLKICVTKNGSIQNGRLEGVDILNINMNNQTFIQDQNLSQQDIQHEINQHHYIFDMVDTISLLGICNRDRLVRQLSTVLIVEVGKMKRLLVRKDKYKRSLYDLLEYNRDNIREKMVNMLLIFNSFKTQEFKTKQELEQKISDLSLYQLLIDNFDYKKAGLSDSQVKDLQIILVGELSKLWKKELIQQSEFTSQILSFVNILASRTLHLFENKTDVATNTVSKDYVGINLLLAITLYNVTHSKYLSPKKSESSEQEDNSNQQILSTNSIFEDISSLLTLLELDFSDMYKTAFGKFYPQKFHISQILISFVYQLQDPHEQASWENIKEIFQLDKKESKSSSYFKNCQILYALLITNVEQVTSYALSETKNAKDLASKLQFFPFKYINMVDDVQKKQSLILFVNYYHSLLKIIKNIYQKNYYKYIPKLIPAQYQYEAMLFLQQELQLITQETSPILELSHLVIMIREIWQMTMQFENIFDEVPNIKLDLKFLIELENEGFKVLKYYKYLHNNNNPSQLRGVRDLNLQDEAQMDFSVKELKFLINQVYQFYSDEERVAELVMTKNSFYKCFITNIVGADSLLQLLLQKNISQVYGQLTSSCIRSNKVLIETKIKKFIQNGLHSKYFLIGLFMSLNSLDKKVIERSKVLCLSVLPLMFEDEKFRELVEYNIAQHEDLRGLVSFDNKNFYRYIKQVFKDEETYNMRNHFEKYFSISGLLRNTLNEIIKLQQLERFSESMLLKVLDIVTYFVGNLQLRRAPQVDQSQQSFIFDNLIDYKSFEFLSKLYKISERLVDFDDESVIMNMWYKVVEGKMSNFEILAKFLVHHLSAYLVKLSNQSKAQKNGQGHEKKSVKDQKKKGKQMSQVQSEYSIEFEKQKRYAISIFNYIKARTAQMDLRNSIQVQANSVTWSQKMIRLLSRVSLNVQSKYVLEKIKLKKILQEIHKEINESGVKLQLKGGMDANFDVVRRGNIRMSVNMSQLLQSQTFLETFAAKNRKDKCIMKNLMFRIRKIMIEKYEEVSGKSSLEHLQQLIIKYLENTLVFITNDVERPTQVINFSVKEQLSVVLIMIVLTVDLIINDRNENRFYFLLETFNKLSINISQVQKFFNFKQFTTSTIYSESLKVMEKVHLIVNLKDCIDHFNIFTKILFKQLQNLYCNPYLQYYLIQIWQNALFKNRETILSRAQQQVQTSINEMQVLRQTQSMMFSRQLVLNIMQSAFFGIYQVSQQTTLIEDHYKKYIFVNLIQHMNSLLEFVLPTNQIKLTHLKQQPNSDFEQTQIAFANNSIFWLAFTCLECASMYQLDSEVENINPSSLNAQISNQIKELQVVGIKAMRRILEESDFLKNLIAISKLSPHFYAYNHSMVKNQISLLSLIFDTLENPQSVEDAMKSLIVTIRVQDYKLLNSQVDKDLGELEIQRFFLLLPFLWQQFSYILQGAQSSHQIFSSYRSIVQLLKKSLPSIGIDKKKDIFDKLDSIQKEAEKNEEKLIRKEFEGLALLTVQLCHQMDYTQVAFDVERCLLAMRKAGSSSYYQKGQTPGGHSQASLVIDRIKLDIFIKIINEYIVENEIQTPDNSQSFKDQHFRNLCEKVYFGEIQGEETSSIKLEMRPLYFGFKNIILKEIENIDKEIDIKKFFFGSSGDGMGSNLAINQKHGSQGFTPIQESNSEQQSEGGGLNDSNFSNAYMKLNTKKQETQSKYQNSSSVTQMDKRITQISGQNIEMRRVGTAVISKYQEETEHKFPQGGASPSRFKHLNQQYKSKYQNNNDDINFAHSPINQLRSIRDHLFEDDDVHVNVHSNQGGASQSQQLLQKQIKASVSEIGFNDREADNQSEFHVQYANDEEEEALVIQQSQQRMYPEQPVQMSNLKNQYERQEQNQPENGSSSDDPREKLKKMIEQQRKNLPGQSQVSPSKYQKIQIQSQTPLITQQNQIGENLRAKSFQIQHHLEQESFQERVQQQHQHHQTMQLDQDMGGIATFSKPKLQYQEHLPQHHHTQQNFYPHLQQQQSQQNFSQTNDGSQLNFYPNQAHHHQSYHLTQQNYPLQQQHSQVHQSIPSNYSHHASVSQAHSQQQQAKPKKSSRPTDIATNPNFVADRVSQIFDELSGSQKFVQFNQMDKLQQQQQYMNTQEKQQPSSKYSWLHDSVVQANNQPAQVFKSQMVDQFALPQGQNMKSVQIQNFQFKEQNQSQQPLRMNSKVQTYQQDTKNQSRVPQSQSLLDQNLIELVNDVQRYPRFQQFLTQQKKFDIDYLSFYIKVIEFKNEVNYSKAKLAAGIIIDKYMSEEAQNYINLENYIVTQVVRDYEAMCANKSQKVNFGLFDQSTANIERSLHRFMEEFKQQDRR